MERELGTETMPCPTCGTELAKVTLKDGATTTVRCEKCYPETLVEAAAAAEKPLPRETGVSEPIKEEEKDD